MQREWRMCPHYMRLLTSIYRGFTESYIDIAYHAGILLTLVILTVLILVVPLVILGLFSLCKPRRARTPSPHHIG